MEISYFYFVVAEEKRVVYNKHRERGEKYVYR